MTFRKACCQNWYPEKPEEIKKYLVAREAGKAQNARPAHGEARPELWKGRPARFAVSPHAGWIYSGGVAGAVYSALAPADTVVFVATNHTGLGPPSSLFPEGTWAMPLGDPGTEMSTT
jgi:AmmeMemoRadiSam system protein B